MSFNMNLFVAFLVKKAKQEREETDYWGYPLASNNSEQIMRELEIYNAGKEGRVPDSWKEHLQEYRKTCK